MVRPVIRVPFTQDGRSNGPEHQRSGSGSHHRLMSKVPSLLFDMEDAEEMPTTTDASGGPAEGDVAQKLRSLLEPWTDQEYMLKLHVRIAVEEAAKRGAEHLTVGELADTLRKLGYSVKLRTALGGGWGGACLRNLRHSFLLVTLAPGINNNMENSNNTVSARNAAPAVVLVDPRFREQFEIAHSTPRYERILSKVAPEVVAPAERLAAAVELLGSEMALAFAATGTPVPPWRQSAAMLSKWQPRRSEEVDVSRGGHGLDAAALNNAAGGGNALGGRATKITGGNTVAQKLAMLGVEPATASPISEGMEDGFESWSLGTTEEEIDEALGHINTITSPSPDEDAVLKALISEDRKNAPQRHTWG